MHSALERAGARFVSGEDGGPGALSGRLRLRAYIPGEGLHLTVKYADFSLQGPDSVFDLPFRISEAGLAALAGRPLSNEGDVTAVVRMNSRRLVTVLRSKLARDGLSSPGGRPREITAEDILAISNSSKDLP